MSIDSVDFYKYIVWSNAIPDSSGYINCVIFINGYYSIYKINEDLITKKYNWNDVGMQYSTHTRLHMLHALKYFHHTSLERDVWKRIYNNCIKLI